jgi:hypothetical protein
VVIKLKRYIMAKQRIEGQTAEQLAKQNEKNTQDALETAKRWSTEEPKKDEKAKKQ